MMSDIAGCKTFVMQMEIPKVLFLYLYFECYSFEAKIIFILLSLLNIKGSLNYDPRTLHIPKSVKFTPFEKQYWEIKSNHWDTV